MKPLLGWLGVLVGSVALGVGMYSIVVAPATQGMDVSGRTAVPQSPEPEPVTLKVGGNENRRSGARSADPVVPPTSEVEDEAERESDETERESGEVERESDGDEGSGSAQSTRWDDSGDSRGSGDSAGSDDDEQEWSSTRSGGGSGESDWDSGGDDRDWDAGDSDSGSGGDDRDWDEGDSDRDSGDDSDSDD